MIEAENMKEILRSSVQQVQLSQLVVRALARVLLHCDKKANEQVKEELSN